MGSQNIKNYILTIATVLVLIANTTNAVTGTSLGPMIVLDSNSDAISIGASAETKSFLSNAKLAPSIDFSLGDNSVTTLNMDLRWYLIPLPNTGLKFYGSAGPTLLFRDGPKGDSNSELGITLSAGVRISTLTKTSYLFEARFGFGDLPDTRFSFAMLFGI